MTIDEQAPRDLLCQRLCQGFPPTFRKRPLAAFAFRTVATLMHISYDHDLDAFMDGTRGALLERIVAESGLQREGGAFCLDTPPDKLPEALFQLGQALTRIYDLTFLSRTSVGSTFYDDLATLLGNLVDESRMQRDYEPDVPNSDKYPVDYRIDGRDDLPLFLYGVPNRDKARLTTIMLSHFHRHELSFESIIVFENQTEIPRMDLARLSDVGGEMISSLDASDDFSRKLLRRVAA